MSPQQIWQSQTVEVPRISLEYVRHQARKLERRARWGNAVAYVACILGCGFWGWCAWRYFAAQPLMLASMACYMLFACNAIYRIRRNAAVESSPVDAGVLDTLRYQRRLLERRREFESNSWSWWLPVLPGIALTLASGYFEMNPVPWKTMGFMSMLCVTGLGFATWFSRWRARRLQVEIDALDSLATPADFS